MSKETRMSKEKKPITISMTDVMASLYGAGAGSVAYVGQIRLSQILCKHAAIHSGYPILSSVVGSGILSVSFASSTLVMLQTFKITKELFYNSNSNVEIEWHKLLASSLVNLGVYKFGMKENFKANINIPAMFTLADTQVQTCMDLL